MNPNQTFLRRVLELDAAVEVLTGVTALVGAGWLGTTLQLPYGLAIGIGIAGLYFGLYLFYIATRPHIPKRAVRDIIAINVICPIGGVVALAAGWLELNSLGSTVLVSHSMVVAMIATLQFIGFRRARQPVAVAA